MCPSKIAQTPPSLGDFAFVLSQLRNHLSGKAFHLLSGFRDVKADRIEQQHLRSCVDHLGQPAGDVSGVPDTGYASSPGTSP